MNESRSPYVVGAVIVALVVGLGIFLLSRTGGGPPAAAPSQQPTPTPSVSAGVPTTAPKPEDVRNDQGSTVIEVDVTGDCENCQLVAVATNAGDGQSQWSASVAQGKVMVEVPTPNTLGMYFLVKDPRKVKTDTQDIPATVMFLAPNGDKPGSRVSAKDLQKAGSGHYCWAGTTLDTALIKATAEVKDGVLYRIWADPALAPLAPTVNLDVSDAEVATLTCPPVP